MESPVAYRDIQSAEAQWLNSLPPYLGISAKSQEFYGNIQQHPRFDTGHHLTCQ